VNLWTKLALAVSMTVAGVGPTLAGFWSCPEIDGPAGVSAVAALASVALIAYQRSKR
jgi:hypothetical protein